MSYLVFTYIVAEVDSDYTMLVEATMLFLQSTKYNGGTAVWECQLLTIKWSSRLDPIMIASPVTGPAATKKFILKIKTILLCILKENMFRDPDIVYYSLVKSRTSLRRGYFQ
jgi:hypothetical protein